MGRLRQIHPRKYGIITKAGKSEDRKETATRFPQARSERENDMKRTIVALAAIAMAATETTADDAVKASSFGWNPTNATKCLQAALDSGARKVVVDRQASEWLVSMVYPRSDTEIVFEDGVVVRAMPGSMKRTVDNLFRCRHVTNLVMRGEGKAVLRMNRKDYLDKTRYQHGEHRHAISLHGARNVVVRDLTVEDSGGDGVYVLNVKHALIENLHCSGHARQGTSVISADDVTIRNCTFTHTAGALPECGMDIEPGHANFNVGKVLVENCTMCSNNCSGVAINVSSLKDSNKKMDVTFRNCRMFANASRGVWLVLARGTWKPVKGDLRFENCVMSGNGDGPLQINNLGSDALHITFKDCVFDAAGSKGGTPVTLVNGAIRDDLNNLSFEGCRLLNSPAGKAPVTFGAMTGCGVLLGGAQGTMPVEYADGSTGAFDFSTLAAKHPPKPELRQFDTGSVDVGKLVPYKPDGRAAGRQKPAGYRAGFTFLQYVQEPGEYKMHFSSTQIGKYSKIEIPVEVFDMNGTPHDTFTVKEPEFDYVLKAQSRNSFYRFEVKHSGRRVMMTSELPGQGIVANSRVHWLTGGNQSIFFQARAGAGDVKVEMTMAPGEWISAELLDPAGNVVDKCERRDAGVVLIGRRPKDAPSEIWQLHVTKFMDDCHLRLGAATTGVYAYDKNLMLVEKE